MPDYPGLGLPIRKEDWELSGFPHGAEYGDATDSDLLYVREVAMMDVMEKLTDKPDWNKKVFDETIITKWGSEALAIPDYDLYLLANEQGPDECGQKLEGILDGNAFDCCIAELCSKAKYFEKTGIIPTMEACASAAKSDTLVGKELHGALRSAFDKLKVDQQASPDWHPNSGDMVQDLVHPSMYSLVYGRTRAFKEECVGVEDAIRVWAGKGEVVPKETPKPPPGRWDSPDYYSENYQWLPANAAFRPDGSVKFTSYINNLHPTKYPDIYRTIEKLVETSLPLWDQCLAMELNDDRPGAGRKKPRMDLVNDPDDECTTNWIPDSHEACANIELNEAQLEELEDQGYYDPEEDPQPPIDPEYKWRVLRIPKLPAPVYEPIDYAPKPGTRLIERFRQSGLQIIVKLASIELSPDKPVFPAGGWHLEGQLNEHICATALYYLDSENVTDSSLSFRMRTFDDMNTDGRYSVGQDSYHWMEAVFGARMSGGQCIQNYGTVRTPEGRLLAFPNVLQHRVSPFKLVDPTKPGHRRFIALWLVDPTKRILSTANVPPQQMSWYAENLLGSTTEERKEALAKMPAEVVALLQERGLDGASGANVQLAENAKLPAELMEMVRGYVDAEGHALPMGLEEAREHREKLMVERGAFVESAREEWRSRNYNFCEH